MAVAGAGAMMGTVVAVAAAVTVTVAAAAAAAAAGAGTEAGVERERENDEHTKSQSIFNPQHYSTVLYHVPQQWRERFDERERKGVSDIGVLFNVVPSPLPTPSTFQLLCFPSPQPRKLAPFLFYFKKIQLPSCRHSSYHPPYK